MPSSSGMAGTPVPKTRLEYLSTLRAPLRLVRQGDRTGRARGGTDQDTRLAVNQAIEIGRGVYLRLIEEQCANKLWR